MGTVIMTEELATYSERGYDYVLNNTDRLKDRASSYEVRRAVTSTANYATREMLEAKKQELHQCNDELEQMRGKYALAKQERILSDELVLIMHQIEDLERRRLECQEFIANAKVMDFESKSVAHVCPLTAVTLSASGRTMVVKIGVPDGVSIDSVFGKAIMGKKVGDDFMVQAPAATTTYHIKSISPISMS